jgi:diguanylate cyclase (GGDEF)-like protein
VFAKPDPLLANEETPVDAVAGAEIAFQPIVSAAGLTTHGFEALARVRADSRFADIHAVMDSAEQRGELRHVERLLLTKSISLFAGIADASATRLFCNLDNRVFDDPNVRPGHLVELAVQKGLSPANLCIELSERQAPKSIEALHRIVEQFLRFNVRIAIDDFGRGFSGLDMLLQINPHYVKIDQAFVRDLNGNPRKQAIVHKVTGLSHSLGLLVVAEGIETEAELRMVRELGCDLVQGFLIARPTSRREDLRMSYASSLAANRARDIPAHLIDLMEAVEPITTDATLQQATDRFKSRSVKGILPVVDRHGYLHGAIYESDIGNFLFGEYGSALLANKGMDQSVARALRRCPISEVHVTPEALVESYVVAGGSEGLMLTLDGRYIAFLSNSAILRLAASREIEVARDQNPLTRLPGNLSIGRHLDTLSQSGEDALLAFFDFDNFKGFNDKYGFAAGDRALLLFSDILKKLQAKHDAFVAHIGGDEFFVSLKGTFANRQAVITGLCQKFQHDIASLYSAADRKAGGFATEDRFGERRFFPLLRASAVLLDLSICGPGRSVAELLDCLASGKSAAKKSESGVAIAELCQSDCGAPGRFATKVECSASG